MKTLWTRMNAQQRVIVVKYLFSSPKVDLAREYALERCKIQDLPLSGLPKNIKLGVENILRMFQAARIVTAYK
jgi:hypothetical protein